MKVSACVTICNCDRACDCECARMVLCTTRKVAYKSYYRQLRESDIKSINYRSLADPRVSYTMCIIHTIIITLHQGARRNREQK